MTYGQLRTLLTEARLSPEQAAERLGISNMTLRRWGQKPTSKNLPTFYQRAFEPIFHQMAAEGLIRSDSPNLAAITSANSRMAFQTTLRNLGFSQDLLSSSPGPQQHTLLKGLSQIGSDAAHQAEVDTQTPKVTSFKRFGAQWRERTSGLLNVIRSKELSSADKLIAYGALFYLLTPFDLIADTIPVIGFLDDFAILGMALAFYTRRFPGAVKKR